jgi:hypothetical protein
MRKDEFQSVEQQTVDGQRRACLPGADLTNPLPLRPERFFITDSWTQFHPKTVEFVTDNYGTKLEVL